MRRALQAEPVAVDQVDVPGAFGCAASECDAAGRHAGLARRPLDDGIRDPVDGHPKIGRRDRRQGERLYFLQGAVHHVVQTDAQNRLPAAHSQRAFNEPYRAQLVPQPVVHPGADPQRVRYGQQLEAIGVIEIASKDRVDRRRYGRKRCFGLDMRDGQRRYVARPVRDAQADALIFLREAV